MILVIIVNKFMLFGLIFSATGLIFGSISQIVIYFRDFKIPRRDVGEFPFKSWRDGFIDVSREEKYSRTHQKVQL